jgi:hypothetical protein
VGLADIWRGFAAPAQVRESSVAKPAKRKPAQYSIFYAIVV